MFLAHPVYIYRAIVHEEHRNKRKMSHSTKELNNSTSKHIKFRQKWPFADKYQLKYLACVFIYDARIGLNFFHVKAIFASNFSPDALSGFREEVENKE